MKEGVRSRKPVYLKPLPARIVCTEKPEISSQDGARFVDTSGGESAQGVGRAGDSLEGR